jgi:hypothetical protein
MPATEAICQADASSQAVLACPKSLRFSNLSTSHFALIDSAMTRGSFCDTVRRIFAK